MFSGRLAAVLLICAIGHTPMFANAQPMTNTLNDSRIVTAHPGPGTTIPLRAIAGIDLDILLPRGEHVQRVVVAEPDSVRVTVPGDHDGLVLSALRPLNDVAITAEVEQKTYQFSLTVTYQGTAPWMVRIEPPVPARSIFPANPISAAPALPPGEWKVRGDKGVLPTQIRDDGSKVSIQWSGTQAIPAVFALDDQGQEQMVNGYMRGDIFVIDRVFDHLIFRIDKASAHADRTAVHPRNGSGS